MFTLALESERYRLSRNKFLNEGHDGKWVLIKGFRLRGTGFYNSYYDAKRAAIALELKPPVLIEQVTAKGVEPEFAMGGFSITDEDYRADIRKNKTS